jgi:hypothetical protein
MLAKNLEEAAFRRASKGRSGQMPAWMTFEPIG